MQRKRLIIIILSSAVAALLLSACAPALVVQNNTNFPVRVVVVAGDLRGVLSPNPGESSSMEVANGAYRVTAIPDAEWIEYAKLSRKLLNERLAAADQLTGPQLLEVIRQLKDIAQKMDAYDKAAASTSACRGAISDEGGGYVEVSQGSDGNLVVVCK
jgi:hypothetical protein